ncbi:MAG TPA: D-alanyl-D-alanine carboxypeptidase/D-alanyl-D-alanine-endopeptidase [Solirubrobacterales bacterium]|nr:D-alanyl-D-alanine carboxypeptidase/D-alanyl-D-alanine-endopeptidase [Solirubrobacterales bacterium]
MKFKTTAATALLAFLLAAGTAQASVPRPLPSPDRPAVTPRLDGTATVSVSEICPALRRLSGLGNSRPGLRVKNLKSGETVCSFKSTAKRSLASNTKIFTTAAALAKLGTDHRFRTRVFADGQINGKGELTGSLYLMGGGDPSLGTGDFLGTYFGGEGTDIERIANKVKRAGIKSVSGRLFGDDTVFDRLRGVADSGYATSPYIGPLSGLAFNAGFTSPSLSRFSSDPAKLATKTLVRELRKRGIKIRKEIAMRKTPAAARKNLVSQVRSPDMAWMARSTNLHSNNFFAETLLKDIGAEVRGAGTTKAGATVVRRYVAALGSNIDNLDGSGLTYGNLSSASDVVKMLTRVRRRDFGDAFIDSLPVAGVDGTLASRMRGSAAQGNCHAKTGTLTGVSALSGYCFNGNGRKFAFSILMNGVTDLGAAHRGQDKIAALIARL